MLIFDEKSCYAVLVFCLFPCECKQGNVTIGIEGKIVWFIVVQIVFNAPAGERSIEKDIREIAHEYEWHDIACYLFVAGVMREKCELAENKSKCERDRHLEKKITRIFLQQYRSRKNHREHAYISENDDVVIGWAFPEQPFILDVLVYF